MEFWGNKITGYVNTEHCPDYVDINLKIDTCEGRVDQKRPSYRLGSCEESYYFNIRRGNYAPVGVTDEQFLIQFVGMIDSMAVVRLIQVPSH